MKYFSRTTKYGIESDLVIYLAIQKVKCIIFFPACSVINDLNDTINELRKKIDNKTSKLI